MTFLFSSLSFLKNLALKPLGGRWTCTPKAGAGATTMAQRRALESVLKKERICTEHLSGSDAEWNEEGVHLKGHSLVKSRIVRSSK